MPKFFRVEKDRNDRCFEENMEIAILDFWEQSEAIFSIVGSAHSGPFLSTVAARRVPSIDACRPGGRHPSGA